MDNLCNKLGKFSMGAYYANQKRYVFRQNKSAFAMETEHQVETEKKTFALTGDSFPKIIVRHNIRKCRYDDNGVLNIGMIDFLLDDSVI